MTPTEPINPEIYKVAHQSYEPNIRYDLSKKELYLLEIQLGMDVQDSFLQDHANVVVVDSQSHYANIGRMHEIIDGGFSDYDNEMQDYEHNSVFLYVLNPDNEIFGHNNELEDKNQPLVAHVFRITKPNEIHQSKGETGIFTIDDLVRLGYIDQQSALGYYNLVGADGLSKAFSVDSNLEIKEAKPTLNKPYSFWGYKAINQYGIDNGFFYAFAYLNPSAIKSLQNSGLDLYPFMEREDIVLEDTDHGGSYIPVVLAATESTINTFNDPSFAKNELISHFAKTPLNIIYTK